MAATNRVTRPKPGKLIVGTSIMVGLFVAASMLFTRSIQIERVGLDADILVASEQVNTAASVAQANLGVYLVLREAAENGVEVGVDLDLAGADLDVTVQALDLRIADLQSLDPVGAEALDPRPIRVAIDRIQRDVSASQAIEIARAAVLPELARMVDVSVEIRDAAASRIAAERSWAGSLAQLTSWAVALLIPMAALLVYRVAARRDLQRARLEDRLAREQAIVATKDQFIASLSHELKTPLTSILGFTLAIDDAFEEPDSIDVGMLDGINELVLTEAARLTRMIEDLLVIDQDADQLRFATSAVPTSWLLAECTDIFRRAGVEISIEGEMEPIDVDGETVKHLLRNLITNAVDHGAPPIRIVGRLREGDYYIEVRDSGPGVGELQEERLFERYVHRADSPLTEGSIGLGTAVAKKLAVAMGGDIEYLRDGSETVFAVRLPRFEVRQEDAA